MPVRWVQRQWVWAPVSQTPLRARRPRLRLAAIARRRGLLAGLRPETFTPRMDLTIPVDPVAQADPDRAEPRVGTEARADPANLRADMVASADTVASADPADRAALRAHPADRAALVTPTAPRAHRAAHGMEIRSVAISTGPRGATDPPPGDRVRRRGRSGADRSRRRGGSGWMAQSTTGATRKRPCGIPGSNSGASGSSEFGSRCNKA